MLRSKYTMIRDTPSTYLEKSVMFSRFAEVLKEHLETNE